jgi:hypothetical protein
MQKCANKKAESKFLILPVYIFLINSGKSVGSIYIDEQVLRYPV